MKPRTLSQFLAILILPAVLAFGTVGMLATSGCSSTQVEPGQDAFVVEAEKDLHTAFHVVDGFLAWEHANRATVGPEVTALADDLRVQFPAYLQSAGAVLKAYKLNRTPEGKASLTTWLTTINTAVLQAVKHLPTDQADAAYRTAK